MSVLRIYQNPIAINALRNLSITGSSISKSLERLSSGLRINRAADDAAGLSISEKLRAQIRGLTRASANALDGISLIQTAEGALNEVHSVLQRMRELSVQAANGIYTASDRSAIQLEVSQLIDEINRIAGSTEFNTKKLLDGTLGALVSTDDYSKVNAAVIGNVGDGGNFVMKAIAKSTGQLQVQKTDVFSTTQELDAVGKVNYLKTWRADATMTTADLTGLGRTGADAVALPFFISNTMIFSTNATETATLALDGTGVLASHAVGADNAINVFQSANVTLGVDALVFTTIDDTNGTLVHSIILDAINTADFNTLAAAIGNELFNNGGITLISAATDITFNGANGAFSINLATGAGANASLVAIQFIDTDNSGSEYFISFSGGSIGTDGGGGAGVQNFDTNIFYNQIQVSFFNRGEDFSAALTATNSNVYTTGDLGVNGTGLLDFRLATDFDWTGQLAGQRQTDTIRWDKYTGDNSIQHNMFLSQAGPAATSGTYMVSTVNNYIYVMFEFNNELYTSLVAQGIDQTVALAQSRGARIFEKGGSNVFSAARVYEGAVGGPLENVVFNMASNVINQAGETATFNVSTNNVLTGDQLNTLASLNRFQEFGVFLGRRNIEFTVFLRGTEYSETVNISRNDTLEDLANKISLALWNPDKGTGVINSGILNGQQPPDLVHVNTVGVAKGTISITTPIPGAQIVLAGDEALLNALSLFEVQSGIAPVYSVSAFNLEKGISVGSTIVDSNEIVGLLPGLRVFFDNTLGLRLDPMPPPAGGGNQTSFAYFQPIERPVISLAGEIESFFIHVAPREFTLQVGANQGQTISGFIADHSAKALGVEGLLITESTMAQEAISIIDEAINRVSDMRSRLGAIQNRLENTIRNVDVAAENLTASESRIRDADVAAETLMMTRNQILLQAGVAALAQANQLPQTVLQLLG